MQYQEHLKNLKRRNYRHYYFNSDSARYLSRIISAPILVGTFLSHNLKRRNFIQWRHLKIIWEEDIKNTSQAIHRSFNEENQRLDEMREKNKDGKEEIYWSYIEKKLKRDLFEEVAETESAGVAWANFFLESGDEFAWLPFHAKSLPLILFCGVDKIRKGHHPTTSCAFHRKVEGLTTWVVVPCVFIYRGKVAECCVWTCRTTWWFIYRQCGRAFIDSVGRRVGLTR